MKQLIKFCLVGLSSTIIDKGIQRVLLLSFPLWPWWFCQTISFCFGVTNGFFWNRRWTFRAHGSGSSRIQYPKFVATNAVGLVLNLAFTKLFLISLTGTVVSGTNPPANTVLFASLLAIPIVVVWNFSASRFWTFRPSKAATEISAPPIASSD
jgi:putative flippase GtrA